MAEQAAAASPVYEPTWDSVNEHDPSPEWFKDAKFGVYWHWGAFSVPQYGFEWYPRIMYFDGSNENNHHKAVYGDPKDLSANGFGYDKFITGGTDRNGNKVQFDPKLASEGGQFDPVAWAALIKKSGAQFAGPVAEHHDGFSMWDSEVNEWNSVDKGPNLDLMKIFRDEIGKQDLKYMVAMHHAYNTNGFFAGAPQQPTDSLKKLFGQLPSEESNQLWYDKLKEVVDEAQPDLIWQDFGLDIEGPDAVNCAPIDGTPRCLIDEQQRLNFLSYYFNKGEEWGKDVVSTYKHFDKGFSNKSSVEDYERGGPADIVYPYWLTDDSVSAGSWSYVNGLGYYNSTQMVHSLMDRVSKNGNLLLNIAPRADGSIPEEQQKLLLDIGDYLGRNGEAVYGTRAWDVFGEGPTKVGGGSFTAPMTGTPSDIRYTVSKDDSKLYATVLGWPGSGATVDLATLSSRSTDLSGLRSVKLFGAKAGDRIDLAYTQDGSGLHVTLPADKPVESSAYVIELGFDGGVPAPANATNVALFDADNGVGAGASVKPGSYTAEQLTERGIAPASISSVRVGAQTRVEAFASDDLTGTPTVYAPGTAGAATSPIGSIRVTAALAGEYAATAVANGLSWDSNGSTVDGAPVVQNTPNGGATQQWRFEETDSGYVRIVHVATGRSIESVSANGGDATQLRNSVEGKASQQWMPSLADGSYVFTNRANSNLVLDSGGAVAPGSPLKQWASGGSVNFRFTLGAPASNPLAGDVTIKSIVNGLSVDTGGATSSGAPVVQQLSGASNANQQWRFAPTDGGYYKITHIGSGRVIESVTPAQGAGTELRDAVASRPAQEWRPIAVGNAYVLQNRANTNLVLDSGGRVAAGSPLKQWVNDGSQNLQFAIAPVSAEAVVQATVDETRPYGTAGTVRVKVSGTQGEATGTVTVSSAGTPLGSTQLKGGAGEVSLKGDALPPGTHTLRVSYSGDTAYAPVISSLTAKITEAPAATVAATATTRCVAGKVTLVVSAKNTGNAPVDLTVSTRWGKKSYSAVAAGKIVSVAQSARATSVSAGSATVSVKPAGTTSNPAKVSAAYAARSCG